MLKKISVVLWAIILVLVMVSVARAQTGTIPPQRSQNCPAGTWLAWYEMGSARNAFDQDDPVIGNTTFVLTCEHPARMVYTITTDVNGYFSMPFTNTIDTNAMCPPTWKPRGPASCPLPMPYYGIPVTPLHFYLPVIRSPFGD